MISGSAFSYRDLTWMKWIFTPSIAVVNCGSAFSRASPPPVVLSRPVADGATASPAAHPATDPQRALWWNGALRTPAD